SAGNFYFNSLMGDFTTQVFRSTDGGVTWPRSTQAFGGDKQWMVIDKSGGPGDGNVYEDWSTCCGTHPNMTFSRSIDAAASFQAPFAIPGPPTDGTLAVGPDGTLYIVGQGSSGLVVLKSTNAQNRSVTPTFTSVNVNLGGNPGSNGSPNPNPG